MNVADMLIHKIDRTDLGPLTGVLVIDIGHIVAGPMVASILADFGATVIKVENPASLDPLRKVYPKNGVGLWAKSLDRNKLPITLNLKSPRGCELLEQVLAKADVLLENFRPGVLERLGFARDRLLAEVNERLVIGRVSGWGQTGPFRTRRGYGRTGEAGSGFAQLNGTAEGPPSHSAASLGDTAAAIWAAFGVMLALRASERDGVGQVVDVALNEALMRMLEQQIPVFDQTGRILARMGSETPGMPTVNVYRTRDGGYFSVSNATPRTQAAYIRLVGLEGDPDLGTVADTDRNRERFNAHVAAWMAERTLAEVDQLFDEAGAVGTPVWDAATITRNEHLAEREMVVSVDDPELGPFRMTGVVPKLSRTPGEVRHAGRMPGDANTQVLGGRLGLDQADIDLLRNEGVI
ncbi:CoA transferase [Sphingobium herbicidovorans NBRC 16415]|uniref:CoA transferase n=2 Tax=Sphingobium herbicidovorans TaxID=76947 RepID=A0A086PBW7_SPHHM|nr:CoA transferase [Sphingobium herbicidovorans NBRC 16415]